VSKSYIFSAFQVAPAGELYEQEFFSLVTSVESHSDNSMAKSILRVAKQNNVVTYPVIGFREFPQTGVGGAVEVGPGVYRAVVIGDRKFLRECGLNIPETLEVALRRWESEGAVVILGGWDSWVRGVLRFELGRTEDAAFGHN